GVDLTDRSAADEWIAGFNARPEDERRRVLPEPVVAPRRARPVLPPVVLPDDGAALVSAAKAPVLEMFRGLADYVGTGRKLTQRGNLTLADAKALVDLLGTGDHIDGRIGDRTFRTRSSAELPRLRHLFVWAKKAGVLRVVHGKVVATKASARIDTDPRAWFEKSVRALLATGALSSQRDPDAWLKWPEVDALLDGLVLPMLITAYATRCPVPLDDIAEVVTTTVLEAFEFPRLTDEQVGRSVSVDVTSIMDALELAGVLVRADVEEPDDVWTRLRTGGTVQLTDAGLVLVRDLLIETGHDAPTAGTFADRPANRRRGGPGPDRSDPRARRRGPTPGLRRPRRPPDRRQRPAGPPARERPDRARGRPLLARRPRRRTRHVPLRPRRSGPIHRCPRPPLRRRRP